MFEPTKDDIAALPLGGLSYEKASCYGMPHIGSYYAGSGVRSNHLEGFALCACCGKQATNSHHEPQLGMGGARILIECGRSVFAVPAYELMDAMRSRRDEDRSLYDRAVSCDVLVLDDIGKEASNTPYACERLFAIVDKRDRSLLPTIFTSNYRVVELAKKLTEGEVGIAIASRIAGSCEALLLNGADRRLNRG